MKRKPTIAALLAGTLWLPSCGSKPDKPVSAAVVKGAVPEAQLSTITLTRDAVNRLGIESMLLDSADVSPTRTVGGEIMIPPGRTLLISAPMAGTVYASGNHAFPVAGARVASGQSLARLIALSADPARAQQDVLVAAARLLQMQQEADRVATLYRDKLVSARDVERAQADLAAARGAHTLAIGQQRLGVGGTNGDSSGLSAVVISAPDGGVLRTVSAGSGQIVAAGAPLFEIMQLNRMWVRVPLYAGDARLVRRSANAAVRTMGDASDSRPTSARPIAAPPSADPVASSIDLYYEVAGGNWAPGERVNVTLSLAANAARALVLPLSAIVRDNQGGSWVYEQTDSLTFSRRRVDIARIVNGQAVLAVGPKHGTRIATVGVAELFGTEFGTGK